MNFENDAFQKLKLSISHTLNSDVRIDQASGTPGRQRSNVVFVLRRGYLRIHARHPQGFKTHDKTAISERVEISLESNTNLNWFRLKQQISRWQTH